MRLIAVQSCAGGPWRWVVADGEGRVLARSLLEYRKAGMAARALGEFASRVSDPERRITRVPSVQLSLFVDEKV